MFVEEVWSQSTKWYQTWDDQLLYSRENGVRWAIILYRKSMGSILVVWILHDVRVQSKIQNCDTIGWWWVNIRHVTTSGSHHRVCLQGLAYKVNVHLCSSTSWYDLPQCPQFLLRLMQYVKYLLTFRITLFLSGVGGVGVCVCVCVENVI